MRLSCHTPRMRRLLIMALIALQAGVLAPMARAADDAQIRILPRWGSAPAGDPIVDNATGTGIVVARGFQIMLWISCIGETACEAERPARVEIQRGGSWVTWSSGTLREIEERPRQFTSKRSVLLRFRAILPAHQGQRELISPEYTVRYLPGAQVDISGSAYIPAEQTDDYRPQLRPSGTITVRLTPAAAGRTVEFHDVSVVGWPLIAKATTDRRGRATIRGGFAGVATMRITLVPTATHAGWTGNAFSPPPV